MDPGPTKDLPAKIIYTEPGSQNIAVPTDPDPKNKSYIWTNKKYFREETKKV